MNFMACQLEETAGALRVRLNDTLAFPVPEDRTARYKSHVGKPSLLFGLRPEHISEVHRTVEPGEVPFEAAPEVVEPMGMETLIYFQVGSTEVCGRVDPNAGATVGKSMSLLANLSNMHLIDDVTGKVL